MERPSLPRPRTRPSTLRAGPVVGLAVLAALILGGCTPAPAVFTPIPVPPVPDAPVFASDEEALAAAHETYTAYLAAGNKADRGEAGAREAFLELSTGQIHESEVESAKQTEERGWKSIGESSFDSLRLKSFGTLEDERQEIRTYLCLDVSDTDVLDSFGNSVVSPDRPLRLPLEVAFVQTSPLAPILVSESEVWSGTNFC